MPTVKDLEKAMDEGIISADQLTKLKKFQDEEQGQISLQAADEAPRFFRSFNDIFIGIGVFVFAIALIIFSNKISWPGYSFAIAAVLIWIMAEWLTGYLKINFPSIILACFFTAFCVLAAYKLIFLNSSFFQTMFDTNDIKNIKAGPIFIPFITAFCASLLFYIRFRLPFSLFIVSTSFVYLITTLIQIYAIPEVSIYLSTIDKSEVANKVFYFLILMNLISLVLGLGVFCLAMWFDTQDPLRVGRYSDNGFWLHLCAGPMLSSTLIFLFMLPLMKNILLPENLEMTNQIDFINNLPSFFNSFLIVAVIVFIFLSMVSLIIDRRAMLISSLISVGIGVGYVMHQLELETNDVLVISLLLISAIILFLGVGWHHLRSLLFKILPDFEFFKKLPPLLVKGRV